MNAAVEGRKTAKTRYSELSTHRTQFLDRARAAALLTIPALMPPEGTSGGELPNPWSSFGAMLVNNLSAKITLALFPPGSSFFRLAPDAKALQQVMDEEKSVKEELEQKFVDYEKAVTNELEQGGSRGKLNEAVKQLVVCGNAMLRVLEDGMLKVHTLDSYTVARDTEGRPFEMILCEKYSPATLPEEVRQWVADQQALKQLMDGGEGAVDTTTTSGFGTEDIEVYTWIRRDGKQWKGQQEIEGFIVPNSQGTWREDACPYIPLRWTAVDGEDYGRSHVDEHVGDLQSLEVLQQATVEGAAIAAKVLFFVDEGGVTQKRTVAKSRSGDVVDGRARDISVLQVEKYADFRVALELQQSLKQALGTAFLFGSAVRRDAERVTAEEIRLVAQELEQQLGGVYSTLASELQLPLVSRLLYQMSKQGKLKKLPRKYVRPKIVTGIEALGRNSDAQKLKLLLADLAETFGPEEVKRRVDAGDYVTRMAQALGIDIKGMIYSDEEVQQKEEMAMKQSLAEKALPAQLQAQSRMQGQAAPPTLPTEAQ